DGDASGLRAACEAAADLARRRPDWPPAQLIHAEALEADGRRDEAAQACRRALGHGDADPAAAAMLARLLWVGGKADAAAEAFGWRTLSDCWRTTARATSRPWPAAPGRAPSCCDRSPAASTRRRPRCLPPAVSSSSATFPPPPRAGVRRGACSPPSGGTSCRP